MKTMRNAVIIFIFSFFVFSLASCDNNNPLKTDDKPELLIYCGITMSPAIKKIAEMFEKTENVKINLVADSSGYLLDSILLNKKGDIFYPGNVSFIYKLREKDMILSSRYLGYNQAVFIVYKGNPKNIKPDIYEVMRSDISIAIADANYSSIGKEIKRILSKLSIYEAVMNRAVYTASNSRGLSESVKNKDADLAINWKAVAYFEENKNKLEVINLPENIAKKHYLIMSSLTCSNHKKLAEKFLNFASSYDTQEILINYGLSD